MHFALMKKHFFRRVNAPFAFLKLSVSYVLQTNKRIYLQLLDIEVSMEEIEESKVEELFELVQDSEDLSQEFKQGFSQRRLEIMEDFGKDIKKIMKIFETHQKQFKIKAQTVAAKKRSTGERYRKCILFRHSMIFYNYLKRS